MIVVRFLKSYPPYNAGETAGFEPEMAQRLIFSGVASPEEKEEKVSKIISGPPKDKMIKSPPKKK